jgi:hypothetical protein
MLNLQENEFFCNTCQSNHKLDKVIEYEKTAPNSWIPMNLRRTKKIGFIFTKGSVMYQAHIEKFNHHDWGNVALLEQQIEAEKQAEKEALQNELDYYLKVGAE